MSDDVSDSASGLVLRGPRPAELLAPPPPPSARPFGCRTSLSEVLEYAEVLAGEIEARAQRIGELLGPFAAELAYHAKKGADLELPDLPLLLKAQAEIARQLRVLTQVVDLRASRPGPVLAEGAWRGPECRKRRKP